ncbi:glucosamine-6-phosphate deaminase [Thermosediminibacter oceani]|uniref:Glucosamine-6-phosphate deaminase n=1 Tax=Thermosediminibacter oceani (strain ATCC BAA-1034 / DSM 16646 / JW/IW-1228P) TaxID=555079 RepID=D9S0U3_THEOJ|nr:glucosamine-6-phosphate deaminase [Thermosediminibacter oceani]ADL07107.1 glucosamine-6-phosphate isomerase [Thermosediminibacter oceani DSM 16646]
MKIIVAGDYQEMSRIAANIIAEEIKKKPDLVLGLATGSTPLGTYRELVRMYKEGKLDFSRVITFNLDEYYGLSPDDKRSYHYYMYRNFFDHVNVRPENIHIPDGTARDVEEECLRYDEEIKKCGGIDLQLLGIGVNGHIGFNEPGDELLTATHLTDLAPDTLAANARFFGSIDEVPRKAITVGLGTIIQAKKILLLASGPEKAAIMAELLDDDAVSTRVPASFLLLHRDVTVVMDKDAAAKKR